MSRYKLCPSSVFYGLPLVVSSCSSVAMKDRKVESISTFSMDLEPKGNGYGSLKLKLEQSKQRIIFTTDENLDNLLRSMFRHIKRFRAPDENRTRNTEKSMSR